MPIHRSLAASLLCGGILLSPWSFAAEPPLSQSTEHFDEASGEQLFQGICQGCHMPDGQGAQGAGRYPALAANPRLASAGYPIYMVSHGNGGMPSFKDYLSDAQIAAVVNYVSTHFGNHYDDRQSAADVAKIARR